MAESPVLRVTLVYSPAPRQVRELQLEVPATSSVMQAIGASEVRREFPALDLAGAQLGVWGRKCTGAQSLRDGDRIEIYRPLLVDPKFARRERFRKQGARAAGLFARKRAGAKSGY